MFIFDSILRMCSKVKASEIKNGNASAAPLPYLPCARVRWVAGRFLAWLFC
jgi:hypothetical protein